MIEEFGLQSGGRAESILMSLPPEVTWNKKYDFTKYEKKLMEMFSLARK
jgi:coproporphyrinogen III oxidase